MKRAKIVRDSAKLMRRKMFVNRCDDGEEDVFWLTTSLAMVVASIYGVAKWIKYKIDAHDFVMKIKKGEITEKTIIKGITDNFVQTDQFLKSRGLTDKQIVKYKLIIKKLYACNTFEEYLMILRRYDFVDDSTARAIQYTMANYREGERRAAKL